jgi:catechol 2,3-dioxygenase-like lactoylglutathione lyase family enzyme
LISGLHHYALRVPDLAVADSFLQDFGLETADAAGSLVARCPGRGQDQVRLIEGGGAAKQLHYVSFTVQPGTLDALRESLERDGTPVIEPPAGAPEEGLWTRDPDGTPVQLLDVEPAKPRPVAEVLVNIGASRQRIGTAQWREATADVLPRRLGHTLLFTPQPARMTDFYTTVLGLRVSDRPPRPRRSAPPAVRLTSGHPPE